jgi:glyoxylase-like metal-dependent hydrolase (beta-lactamase superfamily II)
VFPNATYVLSKPEMTFWQSRIADGAADQRAIVAMMEQQGLRLIDMDEQIIPGMTAIPIPGHTPGHIAVLIASEDQQLIHLADLVHVPIQFAHPEWSPTFDADISISVPTRRAALERAADRKMTALFYHLTFPGLGKITRATKGFAWQPVKL